MTNKQETYVVLLAKSIGWMVVDCLSILWQHDRQEKFMINMIRKEGLFSVGRYSRKVLAKSEA